MRELVDRLPRVPKACVWELTLRCNLNCGHCGSRAGLARGQEMSRDRMLQVARELAALGCGRVTLSGGEPTMCEHWRDVASEGARSGMRMNMITNAVAGGRELVRQARDSGLVNLGVSVDGMQREHDTLRRKPGLFAKAMQLIDDCNAEGFPVGAITTIHKSNFRQLQELHELLKGRVFVWQLQIGAAMGNLREHRCEQIAPEDLLEIVPTLAKLFRRCEINIRVADNVGYYGPFEETLRARRNRPVPCWTGCLAGCRNVGIQANGGVKGCLSIQASEATEGNLQQDSLVDIWNREGAFAYTRGFQLDDLGGFCRTCEHAAVCRGGCLSMRTCEGGGENPFCYHRVATLAERAAARRKPRYSPMVLAPAAILAAMGCGGTVDDAVAIYSAVSPTPDAGKDAASEPGDVLYGIWDANQEVAPHYGIPDGAPDDSATWYAMDVAPPDANEGGKVYGIDVPDADAATDAEDEPMYLYGMPPKQ
jgi:radical SAM protein with 4Fe4S-binding SPASM domain